MTLVISDREDAFALERARKHNIPTMFFAEKHAGREEFDGAIIAALQAQIDLVILAGICV